MNSTQTLQQSLREYVEAGLVMKEVFEGQEDNWKLELVRLRRVQSAQLASLSDSLHKWSAEKLDPAEGEEIRGLFSDMRRAIALTHTEWPLSLINDEGSLKAYTQAVQASIKMSERFFTAIHAHLGGW